MGVARVFAMALARVAVVVGGSDRSIESEPVAKTDEMCVLQEKLGEEDESDRAAHLYQVALDPPSGVYTHEYTRHLYSCACQ